MYSQSSIQSPLPVNTVVKSELKRKVDRDFASGGLMEKKLEQRVRDILEQEKRNEKSGKKMAKRGEEGADEKPRGKLKRGEE